MGRIQNRERLSTPLVPITGENPLTHPEARLLLVRFLLQGIELSEQEHIASRLGDRASVMESTSSFKALLLEFVTSPDLFTVAQIRVNESDKDTGVSICLHRRMTSGSDENKDIILTRGNYLGGSDQYERVWVDYGKSQQDSDEVFVVESVLPSYVTRIKLVTRGNRLQKEVVRSKVVLPDGVDVKSYQTIDDMQFTLLRRIIKQTAFALSVQDATISA